MFLEKKIEDDFELGHKLADFEGGSINGSDKAGSNLGRSAGGKSGSQQRSGLTS
mgnify:CR=1 FL=1